ncbi:uncharacterized protein [Halyomorpha halys]|uniref:uncharacterized protein n=1 Tax=Halyomorpha halys TaxID=286706 RepID=UPI000D0C7948|nr:uncharacterized protein LOC106678225 [Halyomorpha halys]
MKRCRLFIACLLGGCVVLTLYLNESSSSRPSAATSSLQRHRGRRDLDSYYDFLINEWSFKFWAVFQLVTIAVLLYSTFAAIYYAKYTYLHNPPTDEDFWRRRALRAIYSHPQIPGITA